MIGGFHVSGAIAMSADACRPSARSCSTRASRWSWARSRSAGPTCCGTRSLGALQPLYDFLEEPARPRRQAAARAPRADAAQVRPQATSGTIDAGRGCPFSCSFCTIINVQGRKMRCRGAAHILEQIRDNYLLKAGEGVRHYFFTDDNFARNPEWEAIFDGLIAPARAEGIPIDFMMQVDVLAPQIAGFVDKAARAGCVQVFIGMETLRDDNLEAGGKQQNNAADYRQHDRRLAPAGRRLPRGLHHRLPVRHLRAGDGRRARAPRRAARRPGLVLHAHAAARLRGSPRSRRRGVAMDRDYNNFDSFHPTVAPSADDARGMGAGRTGTRGPSSTPFEHMRRTLLAPEPPYLLGGAQEPAVVPRGR